MEGYFAKMKLLNLSFMHTETVSRGESEGYHKIGKYHLQCKNL